MGTPLTNKYAEGYPGKRYYGGCEFVDVAESIAIERAKRLFGSDHAKRPSPTPARRRTWAAYFALLKPGDTILGMELNHGGHLTHGSPVNFSGQLFEFLRYGVAEGDQRIDYDQVRDLARRHRPKMIQCGYTAYSRIIDFEAFGEIARDVGAVLFAGHRAHCRTRRRRRASLANRARRRGHDDHAQDPARTPRRHDPVRFRARGTRSTRAVFSTDARADRSST